MSKITPFPKKKKPKKRVSNAFKIALRTVKRHGKLKPQKGK